MDSIKWKSQHGNNMANSMKMFQTDPRTEEPNPGSCTTKVTNEKEVNKTIKLTTSIFPCVMTGSQNQKKLLSDSRSLFGHS